MGVGFLGAGCFPFVIGVGVMWRLKGRCAGFGQDRRQRQADVTSVGTRGSVCRSCAAWDLILLSSFS